MSNTIEKTFRAGDLPPQLRGDIEPDASVLVSVRRLTDNGFTELSDRLSAISSHRDQDDKNNVAQGHRS